MNLNRLHDNKYLPVLTIPNIMADANNKGDGTLRGYCVPSGSSCWRPAGVSVATGSVVVLDSLGASSSSEGVEYSILF